MPETLAALVAFVREHQRCGETGWRPGRGRTKPRESLRANRSPHTLAHWATHSRATASNRRSTACRPATRRCSPTRLCSRTGPDTSPLCGRAHGRPESGTAKRPPPPAATTPRPPARSGDDYHCLHRVSPWAPRRSSSLARPGSLAGGSGARPAPRPHSGCRGPWVGARPPGAGPPICA